MGEDPEPKLEIFLLKRKSNWRRIDSALQLLRV